MNRLADFNPPAEVIAAAQLLEEYFLREHNSSEWQFMGVQSRTAQGERQHCKLNSGGGVCDQCAAGHYERCRYRA
jgi:hypothetical protein